MYRWWAGDKATCAEQARTTSSQMRQTGFPRPGLSWACPLLPWLSGLQHSCAREGTLPCTAAM